jgi:hypothetical protein
LLAGRSGFAPSCARRKNRWVCELAIKRASYKGSPSCQANSTQSAGTSFSSSFSFCPFFLPRNLFVVKSMIASFCAAATTEAKHLDHRPRQIEAARRLPRQPFEVDEITFDILNRLAAGADQVMMGFEIGLHQECGSMWAYFPQKSMLHEQPQVVVDGGK